MSGHLKDTTFIGDLIQFTIRLGDAEVVVEQPTHRHTHIPAPGDAVTLAWAPEDTMVFAGDAA